MADWQSLARKAAQQVGVPANLYVALIRQESGGRMVTSPKGAIGPAQLLPATARGLGVDPSNYYQNLVGGAKYLRQQLHTFGGNVDKALAAYNAGPGAVQRFGGIPPYAETRNYVASIRAMAGHTDQRVPTARVTPVSRPRLGVSYSGTQTGVTPDTTTSVDVSALLSALHHDKTAPVSSPPPAPSFTAGPQLPGGYQPPQGSGPAAPTSIGSLLDLVRTQGAGAAASSQQGDQTATLNVRGLPKASGHATAGFNVPAGGNTSVTKFDGKPVAGWIAPALQWARTHGWQGSVSSGYRTYGQQKAIYDSGVRPAAKPGTSNHEGTQFPRGAVDVTDAQQLADLLRRSPYRNRLIWAGGKDPVHFSHPHNGGY